MAAIALAVGGTVLLVFMLLDMRRTGGRQVAELMEVKPGVFEKGGAKARNGILMIAAMGPAIGVALLFGLRGDVAILAGFFGAIATSVVLTLSWVMFRSFVK